MDHIIQIAGIGASLLSCIFWGSSALVSVPHLSWISLTGPKSLSEVIQRQSRLNGLAAASAAVAAACQAFILFQVP